MTPLSRAPNWRSDLLTWPLLATLALLPVGFIAEHAWQSLPRAHCALLLGIALLACGFAALARRIFRTPLADALLAVFALALLVFVGVLPSAAVVLLVAAATGLGLSVSPRLGPAVAALVGIASIAGAIGWLLPFPLHQRWVYLAALLAIAYLTRARIREALAGTRSAWRAAVDAEPTVAACATLAAGLASVGCWVPTVQFDDLSYHLGLPMQLATLGYYRLDAQSQIWALAPWSGDIVQAVAQVVAGGEARGAVDAAWLAGLLALTWQLAAALDLPLRARWLALALIASQPLTASLAGGMQAELPATTVAFALAVLAARAEAPSDRRVGVAFALLVGLLLGLKTGFAALALPLAVWLAWRWRGSLGLRGTALGVLALLAVCGSSYVYAYLLTGNPLFPIANGFFRSPLLEPTNLADPRWHAPVGWDLPWRLTFATGEYAEAWNGAAGFALLALAGALPAALALPRARGLALAAAVAFCAAIGTVHYYRYSFPALTLLSVALLAGAATRLPARLFAGVLGVLLALNLAFQGTALWTLHNGAIVREIGGLGTEPVYAHFAPERLLAAWVREHDPDAHVLFCAWQRPAAAELAGNGFTISHYDPTLERDYRAAEQDASGAAWRALFRRTGARYAVTLTQETSPALAAALSDAEPVLERNGARLWRLPSQGDTPDLRAARDRARERFWLWR